ncbi:MAG: serine hydrolase [Chloroflexi bacterium]|nr:MAG: serine hydrolase [Chloroflexota bacterium]
MTGPLPDPLARQVRCLEDEFSGVLGLWAHDLRRRRTYELRAGEPFPAASTIKLFILHELLRQAEAGRLSLADEVVMGRTDVVPGSGVLKDLSPGVTLSLRDAATLMVTVSDNVASNLLIGRLGVGAINQGARACGCLQTRLGGKLFRTRAPGSTTTPRDLARLMLGIARRRAVSPTASSLMLDILRREQSDLIVGRLLPEERGRRVWTVASKHGSLPGVRNDVAYVRGRTGRYVIALMSRDCADPNGSVDNEAVLCLARVARAVHDHVTAATM